jgi:hypothetical protein
MPESTSSRPQRNETELDKIVSDLRRNLDAAPRRPLGFLSDLTRIERVATLVMLAAMVLAFAAFLYYVVGSVPSCNESFEQCAAYVGPYQVR